MVTVSFMGYKTIEEKIEFIPGKILEKNFSMSSGVFRDRGYCCAGRSRTATD